MANENILEMDDLTADLNTRIREIVQPSQPQPTKTTNVPIRLNSVIKWELPIELCPCCLAKLRGMTPSIQSAWTNIAKDSYAKKKKAKPLKKAKEAVADTEEVY